MSAAVSIDRAALVAQLAELAGVLTDPEALEISSLFAALARTHGLGWSPGLRADQLHAAAGGSARGPAAAGRPVQAAGGVPTTIYTVTR
jgi:hypothetical protein